MLTRREVLQIAAAALLPEIPDMNPFVGTRPLSVPFSGTVKSDGTFTYTAAQLRAAFWTSSKCIAESSGAPDWRVATGPLPLDYGSGPRLSAGPFLLGPAAPITVSLKNGLPNTAVVGQFVGVESGTVEGALAHFTMSSNPLSATPSNLAQQGFMQGAPGGANFTRTLPPTCTALLFVATAVDANSNVKVVGNVSGKTYLNAPLSAVGAQLTATGFDPSDYTSGGITVTVSNANTTNCVCFAEANGIVFPTNSADWPLSITGNVSLNGQPISVQTTTPALWQAANKAPATIDSNIGAGATVVFVSGVGGQTVRLFGLAYTSGSAVSQVQDTNGTEIGSAGSGSTIGAPLAGSPLASGAGVQIKAPAGAATCNGIIGYSQG